MKNKTLLIFVALYSLIILSFHVEAWVRLQEPALLQLRGLKLEGTITARKATVPFIMDLKFKLLPSDVEGKDFLQWCRDNDVQYIFWGAMEAQSRPKLLTGDWWTQLEVVWNKPNVGFIGRVK